MLTRATCSQKIENPNWVTQPQVFPSHLMESEDERIAILSWNQCISAHEWMMEFVEPMLGGKSSLFRTEMETAKWYHEGIIASHQVLEVRTKNDRMLVGFEPPECAPLDTRTGIRHEILKLGLRSGVFVVDLTGAQCGYPEPVTPWDEYKKARISEILTIPTPYFPHGSLYLVHKSCPEIIQSLKDEITNGKGVMTGAESPLDYILQALNVILMEWQKDGNVSLKDLWKLPEKEFLIKQADLVDYTHFKFAKYHLGEEQGYFWASLGLGKEHPWHTFRGKELAKMVGGGNWVHYSWLVEVFILHSTSLQWWKVHRVEKSPSVQIDKRRLQHSMKV